MKVIISIIFISVFMLTTGNSQRSTLLNVNSQTTEVVNFKNQNPIEIKLKNTASEELEIAVLSLVNNEKISGFGLPANARVKVIIPDEATLNILNQGDGEAAVKYSTLRENVEITPTAKSYVSFSLTNNSATSIPLQIPGVMNPNLSPFSRSGVDLKIGQKILYRYKGKTRVLLIVDSSIQQGSAIEVSQLLKKKKDEVDNES